MGATLPRPHYIVLLSWCLKQVTFMLDLCPDNLMFNFENLIDCSLKEE